MGFPSDVNGTHVIAFAIGALAAQLVTLAADEIATRRELKRTKDHTAEIKKVTEAYRRLAADLRARTDEAAELFRVNVTGEPEPTASACFVCHATLAPGAAMWRPLEGTAVPTKLALCLDCATLPDDELRAKVYGDGRAG
jgi:hypothetical protein